MLTYFLLMAAVALFVWGLMLIIQGWYGTADEIVPLTDLEEIKDLGVKIPAPILNPAPAVAATPSRPPETVPLEEHQKKLRALEEEKNALEAKIVRQVGEEQQKIVQLNQENSRLEKNFEEQKAKLEQMEQALEAARRERDHLQKESQSQIKDLEDQLKETADAEKSRLEMDRLQRELLTVREESQARQAQWEETIVRLKAETEELSRQRQEKEEALKEVKDRLELMQKTNNQRLNEAHHTIDLLRIQKEESDRLREETLAKDLAQLSSTVESLTKEKENLLCAKEGLEENLKKTQEFNSRLAEKEKMLQHELTKSRAQALGLEKICEEFKVQIEEMSRAAVAKV